MRVRGRSVEGQMKVRWSGDIEFGVLEFTRYPEILDQVELVQGMK